MRDIFACAASKQSPKLRHLLDSLLPSYTPSLQLLGIFRVTCLFGKQFDTFNRFPAFLNALASGPDPIDFWQILGDNFYDKTGSLTTAWFEQLETATKAAPFATAFGNHDYWVRPYLSMLECRNIAVNCAR